LRWKHQVFGQNRGNRLWEFVALIKSSSNFKKKMGRTCDKNTLRIAMVHMMWRFNMDELLINANIADVDGGFYPVRMRTVPRVGEVIHLWSHADQLAGRH